MAQQLRALTVLLEDLCSLLSTHRAAADCKSVTRDTVPSLALAGTRHTQHTCNQNTYKQKYQWYHSYPLYEGIYWGSHCISQGHMTAKSNHSLGLRTL